MLDLLNCYLHGFVAIPVILACKKRGLFDLLASKNTASSQQIAHVLQANEGHLGVVLRILESLRWVKRHDDLSYSLTDYSQTVQEIPADVFMLSDSPYSNQEFVLNPVVGFIFGIGSALLMLLVLLILQLASGLLIHDVLAICSAPKMTAVEQAYYNYFAI